MSEILDHHARLFEDLMKAKETSIAARRLRRERPQRTEEFCSYLVRRIESDLCQGASERQCKDAVAMVEAAALGLRDGPVRHALKEACTAARALCEREATGVQVLLASAKPGVRVDPAPLLMGSLPFSPNRPRVYRGIPADVQAMAKLKTALRDLLPNSEDLLTNLAVMIDHESEVNGASWMLAGAIRFFQLVSPNDWRRWVECQGQEHGGVPGATGRVEADGAVLRVESIVEKIEAFFRHSKDGICLVPAANVAELEKLCPEELRPIFFGDKPSLSSVTENNPKPLTDKEWARIVPIHHLKDFLWRLKLTAASEVENHADWLATQWGLGQEKMDCMGTRRSLTKGNILPLALERVKRHDQDGKLNSKPKTKPPYPIQDWVTLVSQAGLPRRDLIVASPGEGKSFALATIHGSFLAGGRRLSLFVSARELSKLG
ncbi:MAG: hypothetical protein ACNA8W_23450, partial [Bradymonadaceae bacterium]